MFPDTPATRLQTVVVEFGAAKSGKPPATLGRALYAQVLEWFKLGNDRVAAAIHDAKISPLSVSGLLGHRHPVKNKSGDRFYCRIGLLDGGLVSQLLNGLEIAERESLTLGKFPFKVRMVYALPDSHRLVKAAQYRQLAEISATREISLDFHSPTSFKQKQYVQPFPLPTLVFSSLLRRWNGFAPEDLHFPRQEWEGFVAAYDLKTYALKMEGGAEIGSQGWARYRFPNPEQARIASILAQFAFFAGVGRKTSMGMGQTVISEQRTVIS
ncbi:CRISPR-associated endoribonuclease Cas6 [Spirulina sp. 06S082]|uniref:CRISPR-associated endoribonuclease Cas6 n=1 Tax=Spirulina sp. 06S082 TaxID=3110248 RepID=UPI002B2114A4|nr:CRISPR-associated endoribonuclease Cas6 [Spirulina sp. 06S082]MEA5472499.1 CRISPR-associated endoribonuclease Cas6 [Spirulina sp. 06S082]